MVGLPVRHTTAAVRRFSAPLVDLSVVELARPSGSSSSLQQSLLPHLGMLCCPRCGGSLAFSLDILECKCCGSEYRSDSGIPRLFFPHDVLFGPRDVTQSVKDFYDAHPYPKYADDDSLDSLSEVGRRWPLARLLDEQIPHHALILDAGCGTGQLANFLGLRKDRRVVGADCSLNSLRLGKRFKDRCALQNTSFIEMNLFRPPFRARMFDVVIANNVLHHTSNPLRGFQTLASLLKPDGLFVLGLYNPLGRAGNHLRRLFHRATNERLAFLRWRNERQRERFIQRYKQPWESRHSIHEIVNNWFSANEFEFLYSSPRIGSQVLSGGEDLRYPRWPGDKGMQLQTELGMLLRGLVDDGLFVMIGRNKAQPKQIEAAEFALAAVA